MKKFLSLFVVLMAGFALLTGCKDSQDPEPDPVEEPHVNYWVFNDGEEVNMGSSLIYESAGQIVALFSAQEGLDTPPEFDNADDCTQIMFPASAIGSEIDLTKLSGEENLTSVLSRLPEFGEKYGFSITGDAKTITEGTLSSKMEEDKLLIICEFTTLDNLKCRICMLSQIVRIEGGDIEGSQFEYTVASRDIAESGTFKSAFYMKNSWNAGWSFTYSVANTIAYNQLGNNAFIEINVGSEELLNGEPFNVAETDQPFSVRFEYLYRAGGTLIPVVINNTDRKGAAGTITFKRNSKGLYDATFDLSFNNGDVHLSGYYADALQPRNAIYEGGVGNIDILRSATLDVSSDPVVLYLSSKNGTAGPEQYDIKGEVPAENWKYEKLMAFSGQDASITWINGVTYSKATTQTTKIIGGNWGVYNPVETTDGKVAECKVMLFGSSNSFAYYYGKITIIE